MYILLLMLFPAILWERAGFYQAHMVQMNIVFPF